jgi:hypothetical protein
MATKIRAISSILIQKCIWKNLKRLLSTGQFPSVCCVPQASMVMAPLSTATIRESINNNDVPVARPLLATKRLNPARTLLAREGPASSTRIETTC